MTDLLEALMINKMRENSISCQFDETGLFFELNYRVLSHRTMRSAPHHALCHDCAGLLVTAETIEALYSNVGAGVYFSAGRYGARFLTAIYIQGYHWFRRLIV